VAQKTAQFAGTHFGFCQQTDLIGQLAHAVQKGSVELLCKNDIDQPVISGKKF